MNTSLNTTTVRKFNVVVEADQRRQAALDEWEAATQAMLDTCNTHTQARLLQAADAFKQAEREYRAVSRRPCPA